ncbi:MAG: hypothetical protein ACI4LX_04475 [Treponema sp.]
MKKYLLFAFMAMSLIFVSCKSTEQEETPQDTTPQVTEPAESVETEEPVVTEEPKESGDTKSFTESNSTLLEKVDESRNAAIKSGAETYYAERLSITDEMLKAIKEKAADGTDCSAELNDLNYRYLALQKASETRRLKEKIEANGFDKENQVAYDAAEVLLSELEKVISENADGKTMYNAAEASYAAYHTIFYNSFKKLADTERSAAIEQKKNADSVKAGVAKKEEYKAIAEIFKKGDSCYVTKNPEGAYDNYKDAKEKYAALYQEVAEKRAAAQKRIDEAKAKVQNIENFATEADGIAPIGDEKIDGIEEKDTVLLEEDKFENPEESVIEIDETVESKNDSAVEVFKDAIGLEE